MAERRRVLVALVVRGALAAQIDGLRRALGSRDLDRIAPHVTLVPPVNVAAARAEELARQLREVAAAFSPLRLRVGPPARFDNARAVVYLAVEEDSGALAALPAALATGVLAAPAGRAARPFVPHVTVVNGLDAARARAATALLFGFRAETTIEELTLLEQRSDERGHPWVAIGDVRLGRPRLVGRGGRELEFHLARHAPADLTAREHPDDAVEPLVLYVTASGRPVARAEAFVGDDCLFVTLIEVEPARRGEGVGGQLLAFCEQVAAERGVSAVAVLDGRAPGFLARLGYRPGPLGSYLHR